LLVSSALMAASCYSLKSGNDVADLSAIVADGGGDAGCWDPAGFGGKGCWKCPANNHAELINACTQAICLPYDNTTLGFDDAGLPELPELDFSVAPPPDMGNSDLSGPPPPTYPSCASLSGGRVVYATGSSAAGLFLGNIAQPLEHATPALAIVYQSPGSCIGVNAEIAASTNKMTGTATYWDPNLAVDPSSSAAKLTCQLAAGGVTADIGFSDVFAGTCTSLPNGLDPSLKDFFGPVQTMNLIVPQNSSAQNISAEATYLVYGFGAYTHMTMPWTAPGQIFQRNSSSGTQAMIAATIGVPANHWLAKFTKNSTDIQTQVINAGSGGQDTANKTVGILASDGADPVRANLHILAFQNYDQRCGFFPDSTSMALDKANVRDGHYAHFGPLHMIASVDNKGVPINPDVSTVLNAITGVAEPSGVDIIDIFAKHSLIPQCAMHVTRDADGGNIRPFQPTTDCSCYYLERATSLTPPPGCTPCSTAGDCSPSAPNCNKFGAQTKGYCEP
jgi:hypothetical protein